MISLSLTDLKTAAACLFVKDSFDYFLVKEASITTSNTFHIDGKLHLDYYNVDEQEDLRDKTYSDWKSLRPFCYQLIKGNKLPESFQITLMLSQDNIKAFLNQNKTQITLEDIGGLYIHFRYERKILNAVTGTSLNVFSLDKSVDHAWDDMVKKVFKHAGIIYEE